MIAAQKFATFLTSLRSIALSVLLLMLFAWNFGTINTSAKEVLAMVPRIQQFEASGVKVVLRDEIKLKESLAAMVDGDLSESERRATIGSVQKLTGAQVDRLFTIEEGRSHCDYTLPTAKMRLYLNSDAALEELGLVETKPDASAFDSEMARTAIEGSDIGKPRSCYSMKLTPRGYNAKSALVGIIRQALN
ncbi:MAG: hypothetical protein QOH67_4674 [Hyphomicrobiales bacterium]|nr:hypothetical protein [Hyphomicrobiales bacterium]